MYILLYKFGIFNVEIVAYDIYNARMITRDVKPFGIVLL